MTDIRARKANERIEEEASLWLARRQLEEPVDFDEAGFNAWLIRNPLHRAAYEIMVRAETTAATALQGRSAELVDLASARPRRRRFALAGLAFAAAAALALFVIGPSQTVSPVSHQTEIAQIRRIALPDGSVATLGPMTRMDVTFTDTERRVTLSSGEAFFEVAHNTARPFHVTAGETTMRVVGTKFDVRISDGAVRVAVTDGVVQVQPARARVPMGLRAGEAAQVDARAPSSANAPPVATRLAPGNATNAGMWREGRFVYVEAPLGELVSDLNRYYSPGVTLTDQRLASYRLTAAFRTDELDTFLSMLPSAAPVSVTRAADGAVTIAPAN